MRKPKRPRSGVSVYFASPDLATGVRDALVLVERLREVGHLFGVELGELAPAVESIDRALDRRARRVER